MVTELTERKNKSLSKLNELEKQPQSQAEKKGLIVAWNKGLKLKQINERRVHV